MTDEERELYKLEVKKARQAAGRKGGLAKVPKGFSMMDRDKHLEASSKGGKGKLS